MGFLKEVSTLLKDLKLTKESFYGIDLHDSSRTKYYKKKKTILEEKTLVDIWVCRIEAQKFMFSHSLLRIDAFLLVQPKN